VTWRGAILGLCAAIAAQLCLTSPARAASRRIAVIVGNNVGHGDDRPLRYAERDASRVAAVLRELGRFDDVTVVLGRDAGVALSSLAAARLRASSYRAAGDTVLFAFYYSGHGSRDGLHLGASRLDFAALQAEVRALAADVRFLIVDACEAGALTRGKGLRARSPVSVKLLDEVGSKGEAILASTSQSEAAQESETLKGSFFTSYLITGLRGAADRNRDGVVGLREAYEYAHDRTVASTVISAAGLQRPTYAVRLAGTADVPLAWPGGSRAFLRFRSRTAGNFLVLSQDEDMVLAEVQPGGGGHDRIGLAPGSYWVKKRGTGGVLVTRVQLRDGMDAELDEAQMARVPYASLAEKGSRPPGLLTISAGLATPMGAIQSSAPMSLQLGYLVNFDRVGVWASLALAGGRTTSFVEGAIFELRPEVAVVGRTLLPRWEIFYGVAASAPAYLQMIEDERHKGIGLGLDAIGGAAVWVAERVAVGAHVALGVRVVDREGWVENGYLASRHGSLSVGARLRF
jgi:hypothetical protein